MADRSVSAASPSRAPQRLEFRSEIEGLRAVAILLVVAAHAKLPGLAGGFVGVDVFFVLSGHLITALLVQEARATGQIEFADFYARRFRRLLPALLLMLVCSSGLALLLLVPGEQPAQARAAAMAALWLSNFEFAFSDLGYFGPAAESNLFLHTWSLGVEEQFYLVWPALIALALGARRRAPGQLALRRLGIAMRAVFAISLAACALLTALEPHLAFYLMPTRAWQFALGALAFLHRDTVPGRAALGWLGLSSVLAAAATLDGRAHYPGLWALWPSLGAAAVLAATSHASRNGVERLLSLRPMQAIGRVSYAWYLWHWPVLLLGEAILPTDAVQRGALVGLSLLLAALSYRLVEAPIRRAPRFGRAPRRIVLAALALMICAHGVASGWQAAARARMADPEQRWALAARFDAPEIYDAGCDGWYHDAELRTCAFGPIDALRSAVVIGDSVGLQWFPAIARIFTASQWRLLVMTKSACPMVDEPYVYHRIGRDYVECSRWRESALERIAFLAPDVVILGSAFAYGFNESQWTEGSARVLASLARSARHVYVMRATPVLPFDGPACLAPRGKLFTLLSGAPSCTAPATSEQSDRVHRWLVASASRYPNASVIDMDDLVCPGGECRAERDGVVVFRDTQHLTARFSASLADALALRLAP